MSETNGPADPPVGTPAMGSARDGLVGLRDLARSTAEDARARLGAVGVGYRDLEALVAADAEAELYDLAVTAGVETAAARAVAMLLTGLSDSGVQNEHDRATRRAQARAALPVLRALAGAGVTDEQVGALLRRGGRPSSAGPSQARVGR